MTTGTSIRQDGAEYFPQSSCCSFWETHWLLALAEKRQRPMAIVTQQTETNRIQQHLQAVEQQLRAKQTSLPPKQLAERVHNLDRLHEYWVQGEFPRNVTHPHQQIPCFIDPEGRSCAVAHLLLATGNASLAHQIAAVANNALLRAMSFPKLNDWVAQSGLTLDELSLIQPSYSYCSY